jgi:hypothetical protein
VTDEAHAVAAVQVELARYPESWSMIAVAERAGVVLVQMPPGYPERMVLPDAQRADCAAPEWLPPHAVDARLICEVPQVAPPQQKAAYLARAVVTEAASRHGLLKQLSPQTLQCLVTRLCARHPWALMLMWMPTQVRRVAALALAAMAGQL